MEDVSSVETLESSVAPVGSTDPSSAGAYLGIVCIKYEKHYLLLALNKSAMRGGQPIPAGWSLPGGSLEPGETPREAMFRESFQEAGIRENPGSFVVQPIPSDGSPANTNRSGRLQYLFCIEVPTSWMLKELEPDDPDDGILGLAWIPLSDLMQPQKHIERDYPRGSGINYPIRQSARELIFKIAKSIAYESGERDEESEENIEDEEEPWARKRNPYKPSLEARRDDARSSKERRAIRRRKRRKNQLMG